MFTTTTHKEKKVRARRALYTKAHNIMCNNVPRRYKITVGTANAHDIINAHIKYNRARSLMRK